MSRRASLSSVLALTLFLCLLAASLMSCRRLMREPRSPFPAEAYIAPWGLNRELLLPERTSRILFVVDHPGGREPRWDAFESLLRVAERYGERPASWVRLGGPWSPPARWDSLGSISLSEPLDPSTSFVFVRFTGEAGGHYGDAESVRTVGPDGEHSVWVMRVAQDKLARAGFLWLTRKRLEEGTLIHEYGHVLGLGGNPDHCCLGEGGWGHCINPECVFASPTLRKILYGLWYAGLTFRWYDDYCEDCRKDIERAKRLWRTGEKIPDATRPTVEELTRWIRQLGAREFKRGGRAEGLIRLGKGAMPGVIERLRRLPGGRGSPREFADWIAKTIVSGEAARRAGNAFRPAWLMGDHSAEMLDWWEREGARFMTGDEWELPASVPVSPDAGKKEGSRSGLQGVGRLESP